MFLDPTLQRPAGWQAIQSIHSNNKDLSVIERTIKLFIDYGKFYKKQYPLPAVSRGEQKFGRRVLK